MSDSAAINARLFRVRKTVAKMLSDRGFLVAQADIDLKKEEFEQRFGGSADAAVTRDNLTLLVPKKDDPADSIFVFFPDEVKVGVKLIRKYIDRMKTESVTRAILVVQQGMTGYAKQVLQESQKLHLEHFTETELLVNITEHHLVPQHRLLDPQEKRQLLEKYRLKETQLPRIQFTDPVARYFGLQKGQVVSIVRPSETAGRYVTYRLVV